MTRLSPSSKLLLLVGGTALAVVVIVGAVRSSGSLGIASSTKGPDGRPSSVPASASSLAPSPSGGAPSSPSNGDLSLSDLVARLRVAVEDGTGYDRASFPHWIDADGDGCDTRHEVLIREAILAPRVGPRCWLLGGRWLSLYDGVTTTNPSDLDVDHVVALEEAWSSGGSTWNLDRRTRFANDLDVDWALVAVSASSNREKSDHDPAEWLPSLAGARCQYLAMWLAVKVRWDLAVDADELAAITSQIVGCAERMPVVLAP